MQTQRFSDRSSQSRFGRGAVSQRSLLRAGADAGVLHPAAADPEEEEGSEVLGPRMRAVWLRHPGQECRSQGGEGCRVYRP